MADNLSAVLHGIKDLRLENHSALKPESGEVQVRVQKCGVCMTDVHLRDIGGLDDLVVKEPIVLGHEFSGVVTQLGPDVTNVKVGDRVAVDSLVPCGFCRLCKRGRSNLCTRHCYLGFPLYGRGGLARFSTVPATNLHSIPDCMDFEEAALMEPLSVCVSAITRADVHGGEDVVVFGAGPIGLLTLQVARAKGALRVCVADINEDRLKLAREFGATHTILFREDETDAHANAQKIKDTLGDNADIAVECTGAALCMQTSIYVARPGGVVVLVGLGPADVTLPILHATANEIDIKSSICNNYCFPSAIKLVASGKVKVKPIISHHAKLEDLHTALELVEKHRVLKVMVDCSDEKM